MEECFPSVTVCGGVERGIMLGVASGILSRPPPRGRVSGGPVGCARPAAGQIGSPADDESVSARVSVAEIDNTARSHLERADAFLANGQFSEAIDTVRRVMDSATETLMVADPESTDGRFGFVRYVDRAAVLPPMAGAAPGNGSRGLDALIERRWTRWRSSGCSRRKRTAIRAG